MSSTATPIPLLAQVLTPERPPLAAPQGRWPAAWSLVRSILRVGRGGGERSNGAHSSAAEESSEEELQMRLCELHSTIYLQVGQWGRSANKSLPTFLCSLGCSLAPFHVVGACCTDLGCLAAAMVASQHSFALLSIRPSLFLNALSD